MIYIVLIISLLLECVISNLIDLNSIFIPLFLLISFIVVYPYLKKDIEKYLIICTVSGLIYDISFYNSTFINTISFFIIGLLVILLYKYLNSNILNLVLKVIIIVTMYRIISFSMLCIIGYIDFNLTLLFRSIYSSYIINIIYIILLYLILFKIKKIKV